jgi:predicted ester cyclase
LDDYYANDFVLHRPPYPDIVGLQSYKAWNGGFRKAFPDVLFGIDEVIADGNTVAARVTYSGTHTGVLGADIEPTGKYVSGPGFLVWHWLDGKVVEEWDYWDELGFWQQLGFTLVPSQQQ